MENDSMSFIETLNNTDIIVANGPLGTRLKYKHGLNAVFDITKDTNAKNALINIYKEDISIVIINNIPMVLNAPTFRASENYMYLAGFKPNDVKRINMAYILLTKNIRDQYNSPNAPIFVAAPIGSMGDAYSTEYIPSIEEAKNYHNKQIKIFKEVEVDFVNPVTFPSLNEALGVALAAQENTIPYTMGFILNENGTLLDGTSLEKAIATIDEHTEQKPLGYLITCTHTSVINMLTKTPKKYPRILGIQPNGSSLTPKQLAKVKKPVTDTPKEFTDAIQRIKEKLPNIKFIAGCCGTNSRHLDCITKNYAKT